jgi:hypothetical protein
VLRAKFMELVYAALSIAMHLIGRALHRLARFTDWSTKEPTLCPSVAFARATITEIELLIA